MPDEEPEVPKKVKRDPTAPIRRPKATDLPRPRLFADLDESAPEPVVVAEPVVAAEPAIVVKPVAVEPVAVEPEPVAVEPEVVSEEVAADDSTELLIRQDSTGATSRPAATFDPDDDFVRDATGLMLRDALQPRLSGRWDPTAELLRPTDIGSEHA